MLSSDIINSEISRCIKGCLSSNEYYNLVLFSLFFAIPETEIIFEHLLEAILSYVTHKVLMRTIRKICGIFAAPRFNEMKPIEQCAICLSYLYFEIIPAARFFLVRRPRIFLRAAQSIKR